MKIRVFLYITLLAVALAGASPAAADDRRGRDHPGRRMVEELNLSADQEARFREINARHAPVRRDYTRRIEDLRERMNSELQRERPSRSLLAQIAGQIGETQKKMNIASIDHFLDVKAVLTPDQFQKFTEMATVGSGPGGRRRGGDDD